MNYNFNPWPKFKNHKHLNKIWAERNFGNTNPIWEITISKEYDQDKFYDILQLLGGIKLKKRYYVRTKDVGPIFDLCKRHIGLVGWSTKIIKETTDLFKDLNRQII